MPDQSPNQPSNLISTSILGLYSGLKRPGREIDLSRKYNVEVRYVTLNIAIILFMAAFNIILWKYRWEEEIIRLQQAIRRLMCLIGVCN